MEVKIDEILVPEPSDEDDPAGFDPSDSADHENDPTFDAPQESISSSSSFVEIGHVHEHSREHAHSAVPGVDDDKRHEYAANKLEQDKDAQRKGRTYVDLRDTTSGSIGSALKGPLKARIPIGFRFLVRKGRKEWRRYMADVDRLMHHDLATPTSK